MTYRFTSALRWTGESGYEGDGYVLAHRATDATRLRDGSTVPVTTARVQRFGDDRNLTYTLVAPTGVSAPSQVSPPWAAFTLLTTRGSPYYVVRISSPASSSVKSGDMQLLGIVVAALRRRLDEAQQAG